MAIVAHFNLADLEHKDAPMPWHTAGLTYTRSGYGSKIPTPHMVKLPGGKRWRRVYVSIWSNSGTAYVETQSGDWNVIS